MKTLKNVTNWIVMSLAIVCATSIVSSAVLLRIVINQKNKIIVLERKLITNP